MLLKDLPMLFDHGQTVVAVEAPLTERMKILELVYQIATSRGQNLYFWNQGYTQLQQVNQSLQLNRQTSKCTSGLAWLLENADATGIFIFESEISPDTITGAVSQHTQAILSNLFYELSTSVRQQFVVCLETYVELPAHLAPLIPVLAYEHTSPEQLQQIVKKIFGGQFDLKDENLYRSCLGLPCGELEMALLRLSRAINSNEELVNAVLAYKKNKLKGQGVEFISSPDVPEAGGLDLLEEILERAGALLKPEAKNHNLKFPKGMILWGLPGTGKSLSAKLAASKMGVPMVAADWSGLRGATAFESRKNLREFLKFCDANGEHGLVLYFDDFDKGFAGFYSDNDGGISRQLAGKLLTWMQERTSQVLVMATVNRLEFLPPELVRRFDDIIFVDLPHAGARYEIFKLHLAKYFPGLDFSDKDWWRLLGETKLLTPAEIALIVRKTAETAFYRNSKQFLGEELALSALQVTVGDFIEQRNSFTPSMIREEDKIVEIRNKAFYARPAASPDKSRWAKAPTVLFGS